MEQLSFLFGLLVKVYDDGVDGVYSMSPLVVASLQSLMVAIFTLLSGNDFYFTLACFCFACFNPGIDQPFWKSTIAVTGFLMLMTFTPEVSFVRVLYTIFGITVVLVGTFIEDYLFQEEYSWVKVYSRIFMLAGIMAAWVFFPQMCEILPRFSHVPIQKTIYILLGYLLVSVVVQLYQLLGTQTELGAGSEAGVAGFFTKTGRFFTKEAAGKAVEAEAAEEAGAAEEAADRAMVGLRPTGR
jgi:hypothetical protein